MIMINANFRRDNGTLSDRSLVKLIDVSFSAYAVISKRRFASMKIKRVLFVIATTL
jgi:predicted aspartyl protease